MSRPPPATFTILVVDDDPGLLDLATELLSADGHRVLVASSGGAALAMVRAIHPDLILLDYHMPKMDGLAVVERLKADRATRGIPVVGLTWDRGGCEQAQPCRIGRLHPETLRAEGISPPDRRHLERDCRSRLAPQRSVMSDAFRMF